MRVLIIDNNVMRACWGARDIVRMIPAESGASIHVRRGPHSDLPEEPSRFDRIVVSGSLTRAEDRAPWTFALEKLLRRASERGTPVLGICFGHQMIARAFGGFDHVGKSKTPEHGWTRIRPHSSAGILKGLSSPFYSFSAHYDEISRLPGDFESLASSDACAFQAIAHKGKPIYGIQFHPEKTAEEGRQTYLDQKKKGEGKSFLNATKGESLYDPAVGDKIFLNFLLGRETRTSK